MAHLIRLAVTVLVGVALWKLWVGFNVEILDVDIVAFDGLRRQLRGTWLWDLRYPLIPVYAVLALWIAEQVAARLPTGRG
ncbi:MAG: hypothetical protein NXI18_06180 [Alphaproteobacteria bacterium]|nr:hypothetical protein [Alphaproteobacteria bacterium]